MKWAALAERVLDSGLDPSYGEAMINLSSETEALARSLALAQGVPVEQAIRIALEDKIRASSLGGKAHPRRQVTAEAVATRHERTRGFVAKLSSLPVLDPRSPSEIMDDLNAL